MPKQTISILGQHANLDSFRNPTLKAIYSNAKLADLHANQNSSDCSYLCYHDGDFEEDSSINILPARHPKL
jgi:hypothetical protein